VRTHLSRGHAPKDAGGDKGDLSMSLATESLPAIAAYRAFVLEGLAKVGIVEKRIPPLGPDDALVRTTAALPCSSDVQTVSGAIGERHGMTLGHEAVGRIERVGSRVAGFSPGQRVVVGAITPCWRCENCQRGFPSQCGAAQGGWKFGHSRDGNLSELFLVSDAAANLAPVPDSVPDEAAVYCCETMSAGLAAAENASIPPGGTVAIFGQGPVGLMATAFARNLGAGLVIAVESVAERRTLSARFGADEVVDFTRCDAVDAILRLTGDRGVDSAIEAVGRPESFAACVRATRPGGTISNVGYYAGCASVSIPTAEWGTGRADQTIRTALCPGGAERMSRLLRLLERKRIDPTPLTTHRFAFDDVERAFHLLATGRDGVLKPLILF
jgi:threonine dehydrogenase-like Zn-dependent dehydrogenase